jgi:hypothetical protein
VHILSTRFNQLQGQLVHLSQARYELFETFTVPSVKAQSTDKFLWLVFTDPNLHPALLQKMIEQLEPMPNVVLIGMNQIFKDFINDDWVGRIEKMFVGTKEMILDYQKAAKTRILVETRLDADDSIFRDMMKNVQMQTARSLGVQAKEHSWNPDSFSKKQYRVFCTEHHMQWGYFNPWDKKSEKGNLFGITEKEFCVTAGLTYAYQVGTKGSDIPTRAHNKMAKKIPQCDLDKHRTNCIERIDAGNYKYVMIRSRTPTSTAMQGVIPTRQVAESEAWENNQQATWDNVMYQNFNVKPSSIWRLRQTFKLNLKLILDDALAGLCSKQEFSCKTSAVTAVNKLLAEVEKHS